MEAFRDTIDNIVHKFPAEDMVKEVKVPIECLFLVGSTVSGLVEDSHGLQLEASLVPKEVMNRYSTLQHTPSSRRTCSIFLAKTTFGV